MGAETWLLAPAHRVGGCATVPRSQTRPRARSRKHADHRPTTLPVALQTSRRTARPEPTGLSGQEPVGMDANGTLSCDGHSGGHTSLAVRLAAQNIRRLQDRQAVGTQQLVGSTPARLRKSEGPRWARRPEFPRCAFITTGYVRVGRGMSAASGRLGTGGRQPAGLGADVTVFANDPAQPRLIANRTPGAPDRSSGGRRLAPKSGEAAMRPPPVRARPGRLSPRRGGRRAR